MSSKDTEETLSVLLSLAEIRVSGIRNELSEIDKKWPNSKPDEVVKYIVQLHQDLDLSEKILELSRKIHSGITIEGRP